MDKCPDPWRARPAPLATYANTCEVGFNAFEFLFDFGQFRPETSAVEVHSRLVAGPVQAKLFARMITEAVERYEAAHGTIPDLDENDALSALIASVPDFEPRAIRVRSQPRAGATGIGADQAPSRPVEK